MRPLRVRADGFDRSGGRGLAMGRQFLGTPACRFFSTATVRPPEPALAHRPALDGAWLRTKGTPEGEAGAGTAAHRRNPDALAECGGDLDVLARQRLQVAGLLERPAPIA